MIRPRPLDLIYMIQIALAATTATLAETRDPFQRGALAQEARMYRSHLKELGA